MSLILAPKNFATRKRQPVTGFGLAIASVALILLIAFLGPWIAPFDPEATNLMNTNGAPSADHWLGTDEIGRDVLSRLLHGARLSIVGPFVVMILAMSVGTTLSLISVWYGGRIDALIGMIIDVNLAFPSILLAVLAVATFGAGLLAPSIALSIAYMPYCARQVRSVALTETALPYVEALEIQGLAWTKIVFRHVLPNMGGLLMSLAALTFSLALVDLAVISYLGFGIQPPYADWGGMLAQGQLGIQQGTPQVAMSAGAAILVTAIAFNILGEGIAERSEQNQ